MSSATTAVLVVPVYRSYPCRPSYPAATVPDTPTTPYGGWGCPTVRKVGMASRLFTWKEELKIKIFHEELDRRRTKAMTYNNLKKILLPGDIFLTNGKLSCSPLSWVKLKIQWEQKARGYREWWWPHVMTYLGPVTQHDYASAHLARESSGFLGLGTKPYQESRIEREEETDKLRLFSYEFPRAKFRYLDEVLGKYEVRILRPTYEFLTEPGLEALERGAPLDRPDPGWVVTQLCPAMYAMIGKWYDFAQLFNFILMRRLGLPRSRWQRILDLGRNHRVCSTSAAWLHRVIAEAQRAEEFHARWKWPISYDKHRDPVNEEHIYPADFPELLPTMIRPFRQIYYQRRPK